MKTTAAATLTTTTIDIEEQEPISEWNDSKSRSVLREINEMGLRLLGADRVMELRREAANEIESIRRSLTR